MKNQKRKTKRVFKRWVESVVAFVTVASIMLILMSVDSDWNLTYLKFVLVNSLIAFISYKLLKKYGTYYLYLDEEEED